MFQWYVYYGVSLLAQSWFSKSFGSISMYLYVYDQNLKENREQKYVYIYEDNKPKTKNSSKKHFMMQIWDHMIIVMWQKYLLFSGLRFWFPLPEVLFLVKHFFLMHQIREILKMLSMPKWNLWQWKSKSETPLHYILLPPYYYKVVSDLH